MLLGLSLVGGCEPDTVQETENPSPMLLRDSSGVQIVESRAPQCGEGQVRSIDVEPLVAIGAAFDGGHPYLFGRIKSALRTPGGRIVVVEQLTREIRIFDETGGHVVSFGRPGEGPGEFRQAPDVLVTQGDTLIAFDQGALRYSWFTLGGEFLQDAEFLADTAIENFRGVFSQERVLLSSDGSFFHVGRFAPSNTEMFERGGILGYTPVPGEMARTDIRIGLVYGRGEREVVLGTYPFGEGGIAQAAGRPPGIGMRVENGYFPGVQYAVERDSIRVHIAQPGRREIRTFDADGQLIRLVRQSIPLEPVARATIRALRNELSDSAARMGIDGRAFRDLFDQIAFPDSVPPYARLLPDAEGNLWALETEAKHGDSYSYMYNVFESGGGWLGFAEVPAAIGVPEQIGPDYILTIRTDEFDVQYVQVHRLVALCGRGVSNRTN